jgi:nucleosome assembly protein 1-like 1
MTGASMAATDSADDGKVLMDMLVKRAMDELQPAARKRLEALLALQSTQSAIQQDFLKEIEEVELKYQKLFNPLYAERSAIIKGLKPVEGEDAAAEAKGIPQFWLKVLEAHLDLRELISDRDREVLAHLTDITAERLASPSKGFRLQFAFSPNAFFKNEVLEKTYYLAEEQQQVEDMILDHAEGTPISWQPGKNTTEEIKMTKPKGKHRGPPQPKTVPCQSFFSFFSPPQMPSDVEELDEEQEAELEESISDDFEQGCAIYRNVIPRAVDWYTGTAVLDVYGTAMLEELGELSRGDDV